MATVGEVRIELWERVFSHPNPWFKAGFVGSQAGCLIGGLIAVIWISITRGTWIETRINEHLWGLGQHYGMWFPLGVIPMSIVLIFVLTGVFTARLFFHKS